jgi:hypothetical protein
MSVPAEFRDLVRCFHQDSVPEPFSEAKWIENQLRLLPPVKRAVVRDYLADILRKELTGLELRRIWNAGDPDFLFPDDEHLRVFFRLIYEQLR